MPVETRRLGRAVRTEDVLALLFDLLGDRRRYDAGATLADLGVDKEGVGDLWGAVCEEFAGHPPGPELDPDLFDPSSSLEVVAVAMAALVRAGAGHGR